MSDTWQLGSRYTLDRQIGSGVMGQVWAGHDVDGNALAFKLLRPELADDPTVVARFLQERNLLVGLRSPYVIRVHDLVIEGPRLAIVMDYVPGSSLRALLQRQGNMPSAQVATLGARIARGLAAVHDAGVLHRDLKPENVLLDDSGGDLTPKIADFGIASLATSAGHVATANVIGTPQYLAPELGDGLPSGRASDLYALGVTLYEMASGTVPFLAETPVALLRLHADHAPGRPAGIPDELWHLIASLLAKNPSERPSDAAAVAAQLEAMTPRLAGLAAPAPLRTPPPTTVLGAAASPGSPGAGSVDPAAHASPASDVVAPHPGTSTAASADESSRGSRRSVLIGVGIVAAICLVTLVAWLLLRDDSPSKPDAPSHRGSASSSHPPSGAGAHVPLATALIGGADRRTMTEGSTTHTDALVPDIVDRQGCTAAVRFALDGHYETATFLAVEQLKTASVEPTTITPRLDGTTRPTTRMGNEPKRVTIPVHGVRSLTLEVHKDGCGETRSAATLFFADATLTRAN